MRFCPHDVPMTEPCFMCRVRQEDRMTAQEVQIINKQRELSGAQRELKSSRSNVRRRFWQSEVDRLTAEIARN